MIKQLVLFAFVVTTGAHALPLPERHYLDTIGQADDASAGYDFEGIVALSNCSGSLVRFTKSAMEDHAMVLTNGHCLGGTMLAPGAIVFDKTVNRRMWILNPSDGTKKGTVNAEKIMYATMTGTDIALYVLKETYEEIKEKYSVRPLVLAEGYAKLGDEIEVISGFWKKGYSCRVEAFVPVLREAKWTMKESIRYSRPGCEVIGGTSGSPIVSKASREIVGINNTGNMDGKECTMNNPCEVSETGKVFFEKGYTYGQQTSWIYGCLTADNEVDLEKAGCRLGGKQ